MADTAWGGKDSGQAGWGGAGSQYEQSGVAAGRFAQLFGSREQYLMRARRVAALTVPSLYRPMGATGATDTPQAWQSHGARCVNNLASKLALTMFPPGIPFIRLKPSKKTLKDLNQLQPDEQATVQQVIAEGLAKSEEEFVEGVDEDGDYSNLQSACKHLVVGGNHGLQFYNNGSVRDYSLERYVVVRDKAGNLLEFVIEDQMSFQTLPPDVQHMATSMGFKQSPNANSTMSPGDGFANNAATINLYTRGVRQPNGQWHINQECYGCVVPNTHWVYDDESMPFVFLTLNLLAGEDYGRSYGEDFEGDFQALDGYEQTITEGSMAAAMYVRLVKPGGVTSKKSLAEAQNGDVITGDPADIGVAGGDARAQANFATAQSRIQAKEAALGAAFLLNSSVQRDGERVTAEEIRLMAQELQDQLGGVYTGLVNTFQRPYARLKMAALQRTGRMTLLPKQSVTVSITTGAAALSRNAEAQSLDQLAGPPGQAAQQAAGSIIKWPAWFARKATSLSLDAAALIKTDQDIQQEQQQAAQQEQMSQATPSLITQGGSMMKQAMVHAGNMQLASHQAGLDAAAQAQPQQGQQ